MRVLALSALLASWMLTGCSGVLPLEGATTPPLKRRASFEEAQQAYTSSLRFGLYEDAKPFVEPTLQARFEAASQRFREMRFSDYRVESVEVDPLRTSASAVVVFHAYWIASPYVREIRVVQHWRRELPSRQWFVTPDFAALLSPPWASSSPAPPVGASAPSLR